MKRYVVTQTILSRSPDSTPMDVTYFRGEDEAQALSALLTAATLRGAGDKDVPASVWFDVTSVRLDIHEVEAEPEPGERVDFDENLNVALDDCVYWPDSLANCSGRMALVTNANGPFIMCEHHVNLPSRP